MPPDVSPKACWLIHTCLLKKAPALVFVRRLHPNWIKCTLQATSGKGDEGAGRVNCCNLVQFCFQNSSLKNGRVFCREPSQKWSIKWISLKPKQQADVFSLGCFVITGYVGLDLSCFTTCLFQWPSPVMECYNADFVFLDSLLPLIWAGMRIWKQITFLYANSK